MARLYVRQDGQEVVLEIDGDLVSFGRSSENTIQVRDIKSSRRHCQIERTPAGFKLVDLESANGTSVNGQKVNHRMLQEGDVIAIGQVEIQFGEKPPALDGVPAPAPTDSNAIEDITGSPEAEAALAPAAAPVSGDAGDPVTPRPAQRLAAVRGSRSSNPWVARVITAVAALALISVVGILAKNLYRDHQLQQAAEHDYVRLWEALKTAQDKDAIARTQDYLAKYPNSPHVAAVKERQDRLQATISRMETAAAELSALKKRADEASGDLGSLRDEFRALLNKYQGLAIAERIKGDMRALETRVARHGQEVFAALEKQVAEAMTAQNWGAAADVIKRFMALHADQEIAQKADARLAEVLRAAYVDFETLTARSNALLEKGNYDEASELFRTNLVRFSGTLPYYQAQLKLLGIEILAKGVTQDREDAKVRQVREESFQLALKADDHAKVRRYSEARKVYDQILAKLKEANLPALHEAFAARGKDVLAEANLFEKLIAAVNGKSLAPDTYNLSADFTGKIEAADEQVFDVRFARGFTRVAWLSLKPEEMLGLYKRLAPKGDDLYVLGNYCYQNRLDVEAAKLLQEFVKAAPDRKPEVDRAVARARGMDVPEGGFIFHRAAWLTQDEHKYSLLEEQVDAICTRLNDNDVKKVETAYADFKTLYANADLKNDFREGVKDRVLQAFIGRRDAATQKLAKLPSVMKRDHLKRLKDELNKRRKAALELIFNEEVYTYDTAKNDHGEKAQPDVDKLVGLVKEMWERPMDAVVSLDKSVQQIIERIKDADKYVVELGGKSAAAEDSDFSDMLASINQQIDIRTVCLDSGERQVLEHNKRVRAFNASAETEMSQEELRQIEITNDYREMMGRKILEVHQLLGRSARKHSEWMVSTGVFSHEQDTAERRTPGDRMRLEGYSGPGGENIARGAGDPRTAFEMWYRSSGHHRNMLSEMWNHMGVGRSNTDWTQNFGQAAAQSTNVSADGNTPGNKKGGNNGGGSGPSGTGGSGGTGTKPGGGSTGGSTPGGNSGGSSGGG